MAPTVQATPRITDAERFHGILAAQRAAFLRDGTRSLPGLGRF
ncbi:hypothetical protein SRABI83_01947 [Arthrobacter sp. Bi83]|nr:hypothetical protein [Arthrobacter sp. Bi83]CAH0202782.1 hypothetical protein SRABI83_01947 [Arthrobacter sp. Bi83]